MADFKKNKSRNLYRYFLLRAGAVLVLGLVIVLVVADVKVYRRRRELNAQISSLQQKIEDLKEKNSQLQEGAAKADDEDYIEKIAREELDLQKPGEKVFSFVKAEGQEQPTAAPKHGLAAWAAGAWDSLVNLFKK